MVFAVFATFAGAVILGRAMSGVARIAAIVCKIEARQAAVGIPDSVRTALAAILNSFDGVLVVNREKGWPASSTSAAIVGIATTRGTVVTSVRVKAGIGTDSLFRHHAASPQ